MLDKMLTKLLAKPWPITMAFGVALIFADLCRLAYSYPMSVIGTMASKYSGWDWQTTLRLIGFICIVTTLILLFTRRPWARMVYIGGVSAVALLMAILGIDSLISSIKFSKEYGGFFWGGSLTFIIPCTAYVFSVLLVAHKQSLPFFCNLGAPKPPPAPYGGYPGAPMPGYPPTAAPYPAQNPYVAPAPGQYPPAAPQQYPPAAPQQYPPAAPPPTGWSMP
ncbi:MAG: hypothetical protein LBE83_00070 [Propionibacteriaceae bacterium]|nr:hypothetical protein [Propionibacteriaceae bacterium]